MGISINTSTSTRTRVGVFVLLAALLMVGSTQVFARGNREAPQRDKSEDVV